MISFTAVAAITGSIAWFTPTASIDKSKNPLDGSTLGAYFAYGNGTPASEEHPNDNVYGITNPRHLYNLAWLQYLGFFNKSESDGGKQFYFELADNIDMTGWVLPPIGTENKPFIGNFNGNGYVISNLTISNRFNDYDKHPSDVNSSNFQQPHILGFFGVIGDYNDEWDGTYYSSAANEFTNTGLTGVTIHTYSQATLMGIAAGYVDGGMSNVAVDASTLNIDDSIQNSTVSFGGHTTNISDFTLVGYTTNSKTVQKIDETIYNVNVESGFEFNATEQGDGETGWGGSIDMMSVTKRLQSIRNTVSNSRFQWRRTRDVHDGVGGDYTVNGTQSGNNNYTRMVNSNDTIGHFNFVTGTTDVNNRYALLGGGHLLVDEIYESYEHTGRFITDGTNYLSFNGTAFYNETNSEDATLWTFTQYDTGVYYISTQYNGTTYYINYNNGALGTSTSTGASRRWQVNDSGTYRDIRYNDDTSYHLTYSNGWTLLNTDGDPYYLIHDQAGHYMGAVTRYAPSSVTVDNALKFGYSATGNTIGYYNQSSTSRYLGFYNSSNYYIQIDSDSVATYRLYSSTSETTAMSGSTGTGYLRTTTKNSNSAYTGTNGSGRFVRWNNNAWTTTTTAAQATQITIDYIDPSAFTASLLKSTDEANPHIGPDERHTDQEYHMSYEEDDVTYFPLNTVDNTSNFAPADNNTAYVIGGSSLTPTTTYNNNVTNVRFGYYPIADYIDNDYNVSTGKFTHIYTVTNDMAKQEITDSTDFEKLEDAKTNLAAVLKSDGTNVYGLHFMSAEISMDALTEAKYVKVNKKEYTNYELPVNSIDFHLKEFGYINFMAGSYFPGNSYQSRNDSFFALYQIERLDSTPNKINRIFEVLNVYQHSSETQNYSYVYQLKDTVTGTILYTKPYKVIDADGNKEWLYDTTTEYSNNQYETTLPANYNLVFNCARIKKNSLSQNDFLYHAWYFEIPMNDGEFCLGSDSNGVGSYLMYLDIGANASKFQRTIFYEKFKTIEKTFKRPEGVALVSLPDPSTYSSETPVIAIDTELDYEDSACMEILPATKQTYTMDRNDNTVTLTRSNQTNAPPVYAGEKITVVESGSSTPIEPTYISSTTKITKRTTFYDVNANLDTLMITQITDESTNGGSTYTRVKIVQKIFTGKDDTATPSSTYVYDTVKGIDQRADMKIYNTSNGVRYSEANLIDTSVLQIPDSKLPTDTEDVMTVRIIQQGNNGFEEEIVIHAIIDEDNLTGTYYLYNKYTINVTTTDGTVTIIVKDLDSNTIYYGTTQVTSVGQTIVIEAS